jgi:hypothetical protein
MKILVAVTLLCSLNVLAKTKKTRAVQEVNFSEMSMK